jgi:hypothetical protein
MHTRRLSADLFQTERRSSWYRIDSTAPHISSPFLNWPPMSASSCARSGRKGWDGRRRRGEGGGKGQRPPLPAGSTALATLHEVGAAGGVQVPRRKQQVARACSLTREGARGAARTMLACGWGLRAAWLAHHFLPVARRDPLLQPDDPLASVDVGLVLPHGTDAFAEDVIVANGGPVLDRTAQVHVQLPEVLGLRTNIGQGRGIQDGTMKIFG